MDTVVQFWKLGIAHVVPLGWDHMLFIIALFFLSSKLKTAIIQCSVFTIAHSCTLFLAALRVVQFQEKWVEIFIALSIFFVAVENLFIKNITWRRLLLVFVFGLIHGLGFAASLSQQAIEKATVIQAVVGFNLGVETAQILLIVSCYFLIARLLREKKWYTVFIVQPISIGIAGIALFWTVQRFLI